MKMPRLTLLGLNLLLSIPPLLSALPAPSEGPAQPEVYEDQVQSLVDLAVPPGEDRQDVVCIFCSIAIDGEVHGDAVAVGGNLTVNGVVHGDAVAAGGWIVLGPSAKIEGDVVAVGGTVTVPAGAQVNSVDAEAQYMFLPGQRSLLTWGTPVLLACGLLAVLLGALTLRRQHVAALAATVRQSWLRTIVVGLLLSLAVSAVFSFLPEEGGLAEVLTVLLGGGTAFLLWLGYVGLATLAGACCLKHSHWVLQLILGNLVLSAALLIPVAGFGVLVVGSLLSLGTASIGLWNSRALRKLLAGGRAPDQTGTKGA